MEEKINREVDEIRKAEFSESGWGNRKTQPPAVDQDKKEEGDSHELDH